MSSLQTTRHRIYYEFITNYTTSDLLAQQAIQVPVVMQRKDGGEIEELTSGDMDNIGDISEFLGMEKSGYEGIENMSLSGSCSGSGSSYNYSGRDCGGGGGGGGGWGGGGGGIGSCPGCPTGSSSSSSSTPSVAEQTDCFECVKKIIDAAVECLAPPWISCPYGIIRGAMDGGVSGGFGGAAGCLIPGPFGCMGAGAGAAACLGGLGGGGGPGGLAEGNHSDLTTAISLLKSSDDNDLPPIIIEALEDIDLAESA